MPPDARSVDDFRDCLASQFVNIETLGPVPAEQPGDLWREVVDELNRESKLSNPFFKIPGPFPDITEDVRKLVVEKAMEAANRDGISREAARQMRNLADAFNAQMHETTNASGQDLKEPWLNAFLFMNKIRDEIDVVDKRGRVTPAHNGRRKPKINELISARCEDLWKKQPGLRDNPYRTACEILEALNDDLKKIEGDVPIIVEIEEAALLASSL
jgi:hypothetical protein